MSSDIRIRKGLDIQLEGKAEAITKPAPQAARTRRGNTQSRRRRFLRQKR